LLGSWKRGTRGWRGRRLVQGVQHGTENNRGSTLGVDAAHSQKKKPKTDQKKLPERNNITRGMKNGFVPPRALNGRDRVSRTLGVRQGNIKGETEKDLRGLSREETRKLHHLGWNFPSL